MALNFAELAGTWKLERITVTFADGTTRVYPEPTISGLLRYSQDRHVWVVIDTPSDGTLWPSAYAGTVSLTADGVVHHVTLGTPPLMAGAVLPRAAELSETKARLELTAKTDKGWTICLTWNRIR